MKFELKSTASIVIAALSLSLTACGSGSDTSGDTASSKADASRSAPSSDAAVATGMTLADGPDVCFRAIAKQLGADTKVAEITSFFSTGSEIDPSDSEPAGQMTICKVEYQNPADPRKLLSTSLDISTGKFAEPSPVEITVMGSAADFKLDDHVIALSALDPAALTGVMQAKKAELDGVYSKYAWSGVRLMGPGAFDAKHTLRLDVEGRLASNDIKESGYASVTADGKTVTTDHLMP